MRAWISKHKFLTVVIILLLMGGCSWTLLEVTHEPSFCKNCHVMEPYYFAWEESGHAGIDCVKCHYPPGIKAEFEGKLDAINQLVSYSTGRVSTKFHAEIPDASCLRSGCHDTRIDYATEDYERGIIFDHSHHYGKPVRDIELRCTSCHSQIVQGSHISVTPDTCFICHFRNQVEEQAPGSRDFCLKCHDFPQGLVSAGTVNYNHAEYLQNEDVLCWQCHSDVVRGNAEVESRSCLQCHDTPDQLERITEVNEVHRNHVTDHKVECFNCHSEIEHSVPDVLDPHEGSRVPRCDTCHGGLHDVQAWIYAGVGGRGVEDTPSTMYQVQVDCGGCHMYMSTGGAGRSEEFPLSMHGETSLAMEESCVVCHGETGRMYLSNWRTTMDSELVEARKAVDQARLAVKKAGTVDEGLLKKLADAEFNLELVVEGHGEHNIVYALKLLEVSQSYAAQVAAEL